MLKKPLDYNEQVKQLEEHGMLVPDVTFAMDVLSQINYYRFTGYALPFRKDENNSDFYEGTSFNDVLNLYRFDEEIRDLLRRYIEIVEVYYRSVISHEFAMVKCIEEPHDQHYDEHSYFNKDGFKNIIEHFDKEKEYYKDSLIMKHHIAKYNGKMPLWVMTEMMSMSDVSKLYGCMFYSEQDCISSKVNATAKDLRNHLHCLSVLRNKCAHAARLYNTTFLPTAKLSKNFLLNYKNVMNDTLFAYIVVLIKRLPQESLRKQLVFNLEIIINNYKDYIDLDKIGFPTNWNIILRNQSH